MPSIFSFQDNKRSIFLFDPVFSMSAENVIRDLMRMNEESKELPINIFINSPGGVITDMFAIADVIKVTTAPINTFVLGQASSAASLIATCGDKRFIASNAEMMLHNAAIQGFGFIDTRDERFKSQFERLEKDNEKIFDIYSNLHVHTHAGMCSSLT